MPTVTDAPQSATPPPPDVIEEVQKGYPAHSQRSEIEGLPGVMPRPLKIVMMGAGSGFTPTLLNDILHIPGDAGGTIGLVDIDSGRLDTMRQVIERLLQERGKTGWRVEASVSRQDVLPGADYIVVCVEVSGLDCVRWDNDIPRKYGLDQCIGDTIGPGGLFKGLRTIPVFLDILRDAEALCPQAMVLNYTNPMGMMCLAAARASIMSVVGLCHSVQGTVPLLARRAGIPSNELTWECAGINHLAWYTTLEHKGESLYPLLMEKARQDLAGTPSDENDQGDLVRKDMMLHFGAFITEGSGHLSEYLPYYRTHKDVMDKYLRPGYDGGSSFYADNWPSWRAAADASRLAMVCGEQSAVNDRSWEYGSFIIEAREKDHPVRIHGNVPNSQNGNDLLISNLPADGIVEVACYADRNGINPSRYGALPAQMAALCDWNMRMIDLAATAAIERSKEAAIHALLLDPLTAAACSPAQVRDMTLEMFDAEAAFLPGYK